MPIFGLRSRAGRVRSDQKGSVLAAGVIILGIFSVMFAAGVRSEGSAQVLDIITANRRSALDVARGGMEQLLKELNEVKDVNAWIPLGQDCPEEGWQTELTAELKGSNLQLRSKGTVRGVSETISVDLEAYGESILRPVLGKVVFAAGNKLETKLSGSAAVVVDGPIYAQNIQWDEGKGRSPTPGVTNVGSTFIQTLDEVAEEIWSQLESSNYRYFAPYIGPTGTKADIVVGADTRWEGKTLQCSSLEVKEGTTLVVEGSLDVGKSLVLNGTVIVIGGGIKIHPTGSDPGISGRGMIACVPPKGQAPLTVDRRGKPVLNTGAVNISATGSVTGVLSCSIVTTGDISISMTASAGGKDGWNTLFMYGHDITIDGSASSSLKVNGFSAVATNDIKITGSGSASVDFSLGDSKAWAPQPLPQGTGKSGYRITGWKEGNS